MVSSQPQARHVIFMGETGSGKSSIINLFADHNHAAVSPDSRPCTSHFVSYEVSVEARTYRLWDTPGLTVTAGSRLLGRFTQTAESSLERFLQKRLDFRELDLFVLCMRGGRVSTETSRIYKMLCRTNRQKAIPVVVAVTHLEEVNPTMDTWWHSHERELARRGMVFDGHACLTCLSPHELRGASQQAIRRLISSEYQPRALSALAKEDYLNDPSRRSCTIC
ncbi:P-loop containing nucleoside triphosphate hydrolase protein [Boletus edulis]|nr:P-loop containing nucleoside triphosphate hydrolase protein [Boletus edulis]